ncbi:hypothetical protein [Treponema phagedenis]|uniref:Uncharacterized protein n=1 Tax=Treponema phagedenis TaxID=162 RepID=A0AAE6IW41_TREPH|nr:hypothetical protein [Treponema phagedenis]NVP24146.1 hypothetical protein [Treponema phagedenis]QEJ96300.1 hypothetical protein FUT79_14555 [Treponema phagedenis]QEJ99292.1 hypothetical protein FUT82_15715 [Treponema phagedenis]QEK00077.1 hypothetical protein FUT84_02025 [Treponema phagedenis]QEK04863.1 hypothetical protein FUT83_14365 [Treponema phagedenis]
MPKRIFSFTTHRFSSGFGIHLNTIKLSLMIGLASSRVSAGTFLPTTVSINTSLFEQLYGDVETLQNTEHVNKHTLNQAGILLFLKKRVKLKTVVFTQTL